MSMHNNVLKFDYCYGCGVCAASCPKKIISIKLNRDGFYAPYIDELDKCINCGICLDVCAFNHEKKSLQDAQINSWAAWSNDEKTRLECSSGGIGFEIGKQLIEQGYHAVGCRYDAEHQRAEHYIAVSVDEFSQSKGSKYIQSYTESAFKQIKRSGQKYLIIGTPCQIDSFRRMIRKFCCEDNFVLMDFYCHCVPSMHAWRAYVNMLEPKIGKIISASWRNKKTGWHDSWSMNLKGEKSESLSWLSKGDLFYRLFLGDLTLAPQCQQCKYKYDQSSADIRIGDLWGKTYAENQDGVSVLVTFTKKGLDVVESLKKVTLIEHPLDVVAEGQQRSPSKPRLLTPLVMLLLRKDFPLDGIALRFALNLHKRISKCRYLYKRTLQKMGLK